MVRFLYTLAFHLLLPLVVLRLAWRSLRAPAYRQRVLERFGLAAPAMQGGLWVHAVSVGETVAAVPLVNAWRKANPGRPVFISTMTPTGSERVQAIWGAQVLHRYAPYDLPWAWALLLRKVKPDVLVIMETELWPNMLQAAKARHIPVLLANARLSERSAKGYAKAAWLTRPLLACLNKVAAQDEATASRFRALGMSADRVSVTGSLKFDMSPPEGLASQAAALHLSWGLEGRPVLVAASTHAGEDLPILKAFAALREKHPEALLILVPRHPERFENVATLIVQQGFAGRRRSKNEEVTADTAVFLGDSMGELVLWYAMADIAFVGGSLLPIGGHNMLEPMALNVATLSGPHVFNFQQIADELVQAGALRLVEADTLAVACDELLSNPQKAQAQVTAAQQVLQANRGALQRQLALIAELQSLKAS